MTKAKEIVDTIKAGLDADADDITKRRAVNACDNLLAVLDSKPGQPMAPPNMALPVQIAASQPTGVPMTPPQPDPSFVLDALIAKLRAELPKDDDANEQPQPIELRIPFVPIPRKGSS